MSLYTVVTEKIIKAKENREKGLFNGIPFPFKKFSDFIPIIDKGMSIGLLGSTGSGKSKFSRFLGLYYPYMFAKRNNYKIKIFVFALEDDVVKVYKNIICHYLWEVYNIKISLSELDSKGDRILPDFVVDTLKEAEEFFKEFERDVTIVNGVSEPKAIFELLQKHALNTGKIIPYNVEIDGEQREQLRYESEYHTIVIIDNFANIDEGKEHGTEREAIVDLAKKYIRERLCNFFNFTVIQVLQNDFQSERPTYTTSGKTIVTKLEPTLASIGEAKTVSRSQHLVLSLFNPSTYELLRYPVLSEKDADKAYDIETLGNKFRSLRIIKNNDGDQGPRVGLLFDAFSESWEELPNPDTPEMKAITAKFKGTSRFTKSKNVLIFKEDLEDETPF